MGWRNRYAEKLCTADEALARIDKGKHILLSSGAAEPVCLVDALVANPGRFEGSTIVHLMTLGPAPYVDKRFEGSFRHNAFFIGANVRAAVHEGRADYTPVFLSQIPDLIRSGRLQVDVALIHTTPPDDYGFVNLGVSVDIVLAAIETAELVIAQVNPRMPTLQGAGYVPMSRIDALVECEVDLLEPPLEVLDETALEIGRNVASRSGLRVQVAMDADLYHLRMRLGSLGETRRLARAAIQRAVRDTLPKPFRRPVTEARPTGDA